MKDPQEILLKYWKYNQFRPLQEEIINHVLDKKDTLALLPTGGGKSICFQIPALAQKGICIVVSPLIALMKDQVYQLTQKGISATAIFSGMHNQEIEHQLNKCIFGDVKFLYVSPERLNTVIFIERFKSMPVNLIAVDEAHCVSQWGYDFRPAYLQISQLRQYHAVPIIALTATATSKVAIDIQEKLLFNNPTIFQASYERQNLSYNFVFEEDKMGKTIEIFNKLKGSGLIYLRSRAKTKEVAEYLSHFNFSVDYYHAGLSAADKHKKQLSWLNDQTRIITCTNAFGMGIDKPNVKTVIHHDFPDSIESYFQEAGRAGRDGNKAYSILLYNNHDIDALKARKENFPSIPIIKKIYQSLYSQYRIGLESGKNQNFDFDLKEFIKKAEIPAATAIKAIEIIEQSEIIICSDAVFRPSRIIIKGTAADLYKYQIENPKLDPLIKFLLRSYSGLFDTFVKIDEAFIAKSLQATKEQVVNALRHIESSELIIYTASSETPTITFLENRMADNNLELDIQFIEKRRLIYQENIQSLLDIVLSNKICRVKQILQYFGEDYQKTCGQCDICRKAIPPNFENFIKIKNKIQDLLTSKEFYAEELLLEMISFNKKEVLETIEWMISNELIERGIGNIIRIK